VCLKFGLDMLIIKGTLYMSVTKHFLQIKTEVVILLKLCPHSLIDGVDIYTSGSGRRWLRVVEFLFRSVYY
jgi:hypothetical protein